jgi:transcriptional regulator with XRE-family HTH domain
MPTWREAGNALRKHFSETSPEQFLQNLRRYCPEMTEGQPLEALNRTEEEYYMGQLILFQSQPSPLPLSAYLASALTGLTPDQRQLVFHLSDIAATVCADQGITLYEPRKQTDPVHHASVEDAAVFRIDRERVLSSDLLIHLCHFPSTGSGEELDFAFNALVPFVLISHSETRVSRMVTGIPSFKVKITYTEPEQFRHALRDCLSEIRPVLEERKLAFSGYDANIIGNNVRLRREELRLTREDVAQNTKPPITVEHLRQIEESTDRFNPSLILLRQIATVLKTTVADLVEPDIGGRVIAALEEWVSGRSAARFGGPSARDRNRIVRRMLLRFIDSLEEDDRNDVTS